MERAQRDEVAAFESLFDRHARQALRLAQSICRDAGRAEDSVQEAFLEMWRYRSSYRAEAGSFKAWAMTLVRHRSIDRIRKEASRPPLARADHEAVDDSRSSQDEVVAGDELAQITASMRALPRAQLEVIVLAFYGELSHKEIAAQLGLPLGTVKGRMRLGLEKLRHEAQAELPSPAAASA